MKHTILIFSILCIVSCGAQSPIISLDDKGLDGIINNAYYKDVDNDLDEYVGTWVYENGDTSFTISFAKKTQSFNGKWYEDLLVGDYQYIANGVEVLNYLPRLTDPNINDGQHTIDGNGVIYKNYFPKCSECGINERRIVLYFSDLDRNYLSSEIAIRHFTESGVEKIKVWLYDSDSAVLPYEGAPEEIRVPYGEYVLVKQ
ncbi:DUF6705 family protein [Psychroserpens sp.]|uniref:DUF6705 family protein n=1 Tax=Psychroserpens sp. TaxID=2020870 RepID=UPI002B26A773|nr:DUF6705 family protein [Psychroserpens sp.]